MHLHRVARVHDAHTVMESPAERMPQILVAPDEDDLGGAALGSVQQRAPDDLVRGVIAAHRIDRDAHGVLGGSLL